MQKQDNKAVFEQYERGEIGWREAVDLSGFDSYSDFLDAYFAAGFHYPSPPADVLEQEIQLVCHLVAGDHIK